MASSNLTWQDAVVLHRSAGRLIQQADRMARDVLEGRPIAPSEIHDCRHLARELQLISRRVPQEMPSAES